MEIGHILSILAVLIPMGISYGYLQGQVVSLKEKVKDLENEVGTIDAKVFAALDQLTKNGYQVMNSVSVLSERIEHMNANIKAGIQLRKDLEKRRQERENE